MDILLSIAIALFVGLLFTRVIKPLGLPAVTGYLVAGVLIGRQASNHYRYRTSACRSPIC